MKGQHIKLGKTIISKVLKANKIEEENKAIEAALQVFFLAKLLMNYFLQSEKGTITREEVVKLVIPKKKQVKFYSILVEIW